MKYAKDSSSFRPPMGDAMHKDVKQILRCPDDHSALTFAEADLIDAVNAAIGAGRLANRAGKQVHQPIEGGLIRAAGDVLYPIVDQIPLLLRDEGIELNQFRASMAS